MSVPRVIHIDKAKANFRLFNQIGLLTPNYAKFYIYTPIYMYNRVLNVSYFYHCKGI